MPGAGDHAIGHRPAAERSPHVWAEVVDGVIPPAVEKHGHESAPDLADLAAPDGNLVNAGNGLEVGISHSGHTTGIRVGCRHRLGRPADASGSASIAAMFGTPPRLLAVDIDGTLTTPRHDVSDRTVAAVARAIEAGIQVVLATGRRYRDSLAIAERVGVTLPLITTGGALIKDPRSHTTQYRAAFDEGVLAGVLELIDAAGHEAIVYTDSFAEGFDFHCRGLEVGSDGLRSYLANNRSLARLSPRLHQQPPSDSFALFSMGPEDTMLALEAALTDAFGEAISVHVIRSPRYQGSLCEVAPAGVNKWSGIQQLAGGWGIAADEIWAIGDDINDLPMIRQAGLGVAMGNADPRIRDAADHITAANDADGLAELIEQMLDSSSRSLTDRR